jgi:hypothetical protein
VIVASLLLGGCGYIYPGFEGIFGLHSYLHDIPVSRITTELECEMSDFLNDQYYAQFLDPIKPAGVSIKFQTDQSGSFQYLGINLKEVGLATLANLISVTNKTPSLQAKVQAKTTASSQLDLSIPQTIIDRPAKGGTIHGLNGVKGCNDPNRKLLASLSLKSFLDKFFYKIGQNQFNLETVCMSKITLNTQVVFVLDVSAGVNPLIATTFILPVSGETFDYNPSITQSLNIVLALNPNRQPNKGLCPVTPQTAVTL